MFKLGARSGLLLMLMMFDCRHFGCLGGCVTGVVAGDVGVGSVSANDGMVDVGASHVGRGGVSFSGCVYCAYCSNAVIYDFKWA